MVTDLESSPTLVKQLFAHSWIHTKPYRKRTSVFIVLLAFAYLLPLLQPWAIAYLIDGFSEKLPLSELWNRSLLAIGAYFLIITISKALHHIGRYLEIRVGFAVELDSLKAFTFKAFLRPLSWHTKYSSGETTSWTKKAANALGVTVGELYGETIQYGISFLGAVVVIFSLQGTTAFFILLGVVFTLIIMAWSNKMLVGLNASFNKFDSVLLGQIASGLSAVLSVRSFRCEKPIQNILFATASEGTALIKQRTFYNELKWQLTDLCHPLIVSVAILLYISNQLSTGNTKSVGNLYVLIEYIAVIFRAVWAITFQYNRILETAVTYHTGRKFLGDEKEPVQNTHNSVDKNNISVNNITFKSERFSLGPLTATFSPGEKIALIGESGSGKSTFLNILAGLKELSAGHISFGSHKVSQFELTRTALYVPQSPEIIHNTLKANLTFGESISDAELLESLRTMKLESFLSLLKDGLETDLASSGLNLSGGQKQRVALARAFLRFNNFQLLLLDEPTSSLDASTEEDILESLMKALNPEQILFFSLHRLPLLKQFSRVLVFENGKIIADGNPDEISRSGITLAKYMTIEKE